MLSLDHYSSTRPARVHTAVYIRGVRIHVLNLVYIVYRIRIVYTKFSIYVVRYSCIYRRARGGAAAWCMVRRRIECDACIHVSNVRMTYISLYSLKVYTKFSTRTRRSATPAGLHTKFLITAVKEMKEPGEIQENFALLSYHKKLNSTNTQLVLDDLNLALICLKLTWPVSRYMVLHLISPRRMNRRAPHARGASGESN